MGILGGREVNRLNERHTPVLPLIAIHSQKFGGYREKKMLGIF